MLYVHLKVLKLWYFQESIGETFLLKSQKIKPLKGFLEFGLLVSRVNKVWATTATRSCNQGKVFVNRFDDQKSRKLRQSQNFDYTLTIRAGRVFRIIRN